MKKLLKLTVLILILGLAFCLFACQEKEAVTPEQNPDSSVISPAPDTVLPLPDGGENSGDEGENNTPPAQSVYDVRFLDAGGDVLYTSQVDAGDKVEKPTAPSKRFYKFLGWKTKGGGAFDFDTAINGNLDLVADWEKLTVEGVKFAADTAQETVFNQGCGFSSDGLKILFVVSDGSELVATEEEYEVDSSAYDAEKPKKYTIAIKTAYGNLEYTVIVDGVECINVTDNNVYMDGDVIDLDNIFVEKVYSLDESYFIRKNEMTVKSQNSGSNTVKAIDGKDTIRVSLVGYLYDISEEYEVTVYNIKSLAPTEIFIKNLPEITDFAVGSDFVYDGLTVEKTTEVSGSRRLLMEKDEYDVDFSQYKKMTVGSYPVTVKAKANANLTASYNVNVWNVSGNIAYLEATDYIRDFYFGEDINLDGIRVRAVYDGGGKVGVASADYEIDTSHYDAFNEDSYKITVKYKPDSSVFGEFFVNVGNPVVGTYYTVEGTFAYSVKIVNEGGRLAVYQFNFSIDEDDPVEWKKDDKKIPDEAFESIIRTEIGFKFGDICEYNPAQGTLYFYDNDETVTKIKSDDVLLFVDGIPGFFLMVKKGEGLSAQYIEDFEAEAGVKFYYRSGEQLEVVTAEVKFTENTTLYIQ